MDDLIKRSDAIGACAYETIECYEARKAIRALPSADRPRGKWSLTRTVKTNSCPEHWLRCSECGNYRIIKMGEAMPDYCENCGCRMKGADDE